MRLAIFGLGSIGSRHARNLHEMGEREVLGFDPRIGQSDFAPDVRCQAVNDIMMIWDWKPEVVLVCTPPDSHAQLANDVICSGAHCFIEKPIATTVKDAAYLTYQARRKNVQLAVGYQLPWSMTEYRSRDYREVKFVYRGDMRAWPSRYQKDVLLECSHELHAAIWHSGPVEAVVANFANHLSWRIELRHLRAHSTVIVQANSDVAERYAVMNGILEWRFDAERNDQAYKDELAAFLKVCHGGQWDDRLCSGAEAMQVVRVIEACRQSADKCEVVRP